MRILVIGGTNFIGPYAVRRLAESGHEVSVFHRGQTRAELPESVSLIRGDRRNLEDHTAEFRRLSPDVVLDMIPMNERDARGKDMSAYAIEDYTVIKHVMAKLG